METMSLMSVRRMGAPRTVSTAGSQVASVVLSAVLLATMAGVYLIAVRTSSGQARDEQAFQTLRGTGATADVPHVVGLGSVTDIRLWVVSVALIVGLGLLARRRLSIVALLALPVVAIVVTQFLRDELLTRPDFSGLSWVANTFPSGHAAAAAGCVAAIVRAAPRKLAPVLAVAGVGWLTLVSQDLMVWGWHRPSDLVGSILLAAALMHLVPGSPARPGVPASRCLGIAGITAAVAALGPLAWAVATDHLAVAPVGLAAAVAMASLVADGGATDRRRIAGIASRADDQRIKRSDRSGGQQNDHRRATAGID